MKALAHIQNPFRSRRFFTALRAGLQKAIANKGLISAHLDELKNPDHVSQVADFLLTYRRRRRSLCKRRLKGRLNVPLRLDRTTTNAGIILCDISTIVARQESTASSQEAVLKWEKTLHPKNGKIPKKP